MAGAATNANIADRSANASDFVRTIFLDGGASIVNPELRTQLSQVDKSFRPQLTAASRAVSTAQANVTRLEARLNNPQLKPAQRAAIEKQLETARTKLTTAQSQASTVQTNFSQAQQAIASGQPTLTDLMAERFPEARQAMERSQPFLERMGQLGPAGERLMNALNQGFAANEITSRDITAPRMGDFGQATASRISAGQVGSGRLGDSLMGEAVRRVDLRGALDSQATRDAIQSARQGFAARGLATGSASLGAELLNRDRYQRQRAFEDLGFAQQVQGQDLGRQFQNVGNQLAADQSNQQAAMQAELANLDARYRAAAQAGEWELAAATRNQASDLQASVANEEARRLGNQANIGMLGDAFTTQRDMNQEGLRAVGLGQSLASAANPYNQAMALYSSSGQNTGSQALPGAASMANNWMTGALGTQTYNAASQDYSNYMGRYGNYGGQSGNMGANIATGALSGAVAAAPTGNPYIIGGSAILGGISGAIRR